MRQTLLEEIKKEALRIEEDTEHAYKSLYNDASLWRLVDLVLIVAIAILSAIAGFTALESFETGRYIIIFSAFGAAILAAVTKAIHPAKKSQNCHSAAVSIQSLRDRTRIFRNVEITSDITDSDAKEKLDSLDKERSELRLLSPQPSQWGRLLARKGIESGESKHQVDTD